MIVGIIVSAVSTGYGLVVDGVNTNTLGGIAMTVAFGFSLAYIDIEPTGFVKYSVLGGAAVAYGASILLFLNQLRV
ncbi:hypothetical protein HARCEL1_06560 [Halococcoides cellulosivorans]|uniref:Uncharacterized protein n=1 Tax=Halococcoides cellulosivorans TaxID=1679096 RepID=A0A2R4X0S7_9EURY|nr:hypothetical protein HARCEL1_06560 [Halococcoides cellulosivorans]